MNTRKYSRYVASVAALLTVSGGVHAVIQPGRIINGPDGDAILSHDGDEVLFDIDRNGSPEFIARAWISTSSYFGYSFRYFSIGSYTYGNLVELNSVTFPIFFPVPHIKKFEVNDIVGPLMYSDNWGFITYYSIPVGDPTPTTTPPGTFGYTNDQGYIGIEMLTGSGSNYGWIHVNTSPTGNEVAFTASALELTPNTSIVAGNSVPVPLLPIASAAGLGLVGLMAALKKRKKINA